MEEKLDQSQFGNRKGKITRRTTGAKGNYFLQVIICLKQVTHSRY